MMSKKHGITVAKQILLITKTRPARTQRAQGRKGLMGCKM